MELATQVHRLEASLERLTAAQAGLATAQARTEARLGELAAAQTETQLQLTALAAAQGRTEEQLKELAGAQARTEARVEQLAAAQARTEEQLKALAAAQVDLTVAQSGTAEQLKELAAAQAETQVQLKELVRAQTLAEEQLRTLLSWQASEEGRRKGERYERHLVRRAALRLNGGAGGSTDEDAIRRRLTERLLPVLDRELLRPDEDPFLADVIWWKGDRLAVIEVSLVVDEDDVNRALACAETLRRAGKEVVPVVIGRCLGQRRDPRLGAGAPGGVEGGQ